MTNVTEEISGEETPQEDEATPAQSEQDEDQGAQ